VNYITINPVDFFNWVLSTSVMASLLVALILIIKLGLGNRLKPRWHYMLWLLLTLRLLLPWIPESPLSIFNLFVVHKSSNIQVMNIDVPIAPTKILSAVTSLQSDVHANKLSIIFMSAFWVWLLVVVFLSISTIVINRRFASRLQKQSCISDPDIREVFEQCKQEMTIQRSIRLMSSNLVASPTLFGVFKPSLIISELTIKTISLEQLRYIIIHELAHHKRKDILINWLMQGLLILHWFNPILWYANRRMREDQEIACDALALTQIHSNESKAYGQTIITLLESFSKQKQIPGMASFSGNKSQLKRRISMINLFKQNSYRWSILGVALIISLGVLFLTNGKTSAVATDSQQVQLEKMTSKTVEEVQKNPKEASKSIVTDYFNAQMKKGASDGVPLNSFRIVKVDTTDSNDLKVSVVLKYEGLKEWSPIEYSVIRVNDIYQVQKLICVLDSIPNSKTNGTVKCTKDFIESKGKISVRSAKSN
jgi:bla regulator protein BlaR1